MSRNDSEFDIYHIPPNFIEGGTVMGGLFKLRNVIEAGSKAYHWEACLNTPDFSECPTITVWGRTEKKEGEQGVIRMVALCKGILDSIRVSA